MNKGLAHFREYPKQGFRQIKQPGLAIGDRMDVSDSRGIIRQGTVVNLFPLQVRLENELVIVNKR